MNPQHAQHLLTLEQERAQSRDRRRQLSKGTATNQNTNLHRKAKQSNISSRHHHTSREILNSINGLRHVIVCSEDHTYQSHQDERGPDRGQTLERHCHLQGNVHMFGTKKNHAWNSNFPADPQGKPPPTQSSKKKGREVPFCLNYSFLAVAKKRKITTSRSVGFQPCPLACSLAASDMALPMLRQISVAGAATFDFLTPFFCIFFVFCLITFWFSSRTHLWICC